MELANKGGWQLVVLDLAIDTTSPSGALMANVMACFAQYERQLIGARTHRLTNRSRGRPPLRGACMAFRRISMHGLEGRLLLSCWSLPLEILEFH